MFMITVRLDPATKVTLDRLLDYLEGKQQAQVDGYVARMKATRDRLASVINTNSEK